MNKKNYCQVGNLNPPYQLIRNLENKNNNKRDCDNRTR